MDALFPVIPEDLPRQASTDVGRVPAFADGAFLVRDGALTERSGSEAVRQWMDLMLRQRIGAVPIYEAGGTARIGIDRDLILSSKLPTGLVTAEVERNVRETLSFCPAIRAVDQFSFARRGRTFQISFTARLYTNEDLEVTVDV